MPVVSVNIRHMILKMAWLFTIHKLQAMTLQQATVDINNTKMQGLTVTTISRVNSMDGLHISIPFSFQCYAKMKESVYVTLIKKEEELLKLISFSGFLS